MGQGSWRGGTEAIRDSTPGTHILAGEGPCGWAPTGGSRTGFVDEGLAVMLPPVALMAALPAPLGWKEPFTVVDPPKGES